MPTEAFKRLPESIQALVLFGIQLLSPKRVILFGSQARGDFRENSDYDIAFQALKFPELWAQFSAEAFERPITLLKVDLLEYESCNSEYRKNIDTEGEILYEA